MEENFIGARITENGSSFRVWAPQSRDVHLLLDDSRERIALNPEENGYFSLIDASIKPGTNYMYSLDNGPLRPDPASHYQPNGVHGASQLVDHRFDWTDTDWHPPTLKDSVIYELHVGTFSEEGTFEGVIPHLGYLKDLGITTIELMPVAQFPGSRNWGYDGVQLFAPHNLYGGPAALKKLINTCHSLGLAVFLDVVYNHLGPEGNYLWDFGPYFTDRYRTPWGSSVNLDGPYCDHVRDFFIYNARYWLSHYRIDGLRLDATHALFDFSARPFIAELSERVHSWASRSNRRVLLIAENDQNDRRLTLPVDTFGLGMDGQWNDEFHHSLHTTLTKESSGYYADYQAPDVLHKVLREGFAYTGQHSPSRKRRHGTPVSDLTTERFIVSTQTHDQVGNRMLGERLAHLTSFEGLKLAACLLATSPYTPMLFMGEEYGEIAPFLYFISHSDEELIQAIRKGRTEEFEGFAWSGTPPDPQDESTFLRCKLNHNLKQKESHAILHRLYKNLLHLRKHTSALTNPNRSDLIIKTGEQTTMISMERHGQSEIVRILMNFDGEKEAHISFEATNGPWQKVLDSRISTWCPKDDTPGSSLPETIQAQSRRTLSFSPYAFAIYVFSKPT